MCQSFFVLETVKIQTLNEFMGYFLAIHITHYLQNSACNNDFQVCILTIHIFLCHYLCMLNHFLNFPQHVQKGTVSLENISTGLQGKKIIKKVKNGLNYLLNFSNL